MVAVSRALQDSGDHCHDQTGRGTPIKAKHYFCSVCGICTHHRRRSNPQQYAYNVGCLDGVNPFELGTVRIYDGINHPSDLAARN